MISSIYSHKDIKTQARFYKFCDQKLINKHNLTEQFNNCSILNHIFQSNDPNFVTSTIVNELFNIIDRLSPPKLIQYKNDYVPWLNREYFLLLAQKDKAHKLALKSNNDPVLWREIRNLRKPNKQN